MTTHEIKRYTVSGDIAYPIHEDPEGDYVTYEDHVAAIEADRQRRGEPVGWMYEDEIPDNYPYDAMFPYSKVEGVRMFPVYAPQPAEPVNAPHATAYCQHPHCQTTGGCQGPCSKKQAEPVKVPSDDIDAARWQKARTLPRSWWRDAFSRIAAEGVTLDDLIDAETKRRLP